MTIVLSLVLVVPSCRALIPQSSTRTPLTRTCQPYVHAQDITRRSSVLRSASADTDSQTTTQAPARPPQQQALPAIQDLLGRDGIYSLSNPVDLKVFLFSFPEQITCVRVHAPWCKTCQSMLPQYQKLAKTLSREGVVFADFTARHNQDFCRSVLDVEMFPTVLIYKAPRDLLSTHPCGPGKMKKVREALLRHLEENHSRQENDAENGVANEVTGSTGSGQVMNRIQGIVKSLF
jgi:thiol-disulfide isomerase/thioredoxin